MKTIPKTNLTFIIDKVINDDRLSVVKEKMEAILKPYQHTFVVRTEEKNGKINKVRFETEIFI